ncbi:MAG: Asp-tRNA(Asn)/Glu-tRNA(Gln) amidotransferase subunit GatC [Bacteroidetes bacterium]|nr:Asp-tRNA(Asn)/Glu-tRNA(Gln) amidotransferase subunit GatC [Bacteroidota bacterium]
MKLDNELIVRLAELSRLEFNEEEKVAITKDLEKILSFMEKLNELDTENVEPMIYVNESANVVREDVVKDTLDKADVLKNAPMKDSDYIKVPKVISQS